MKIDGRLAAIDWSRLTTEIQDRGGATTGPLLTDAERRELVAAYERGELFRSTVWRATASAAGEYRYFNYPLPGLVGQLGTNLYERLLSIANHWWEAIGIGQQFPGTHAEYIARCRAWPERLCPAADRKGSVRRFRPLDSRAFKLVIDLCDEALYSGLVLRLRARDQHVLRVGCAK
jgi:oxygenase catalysing oxidative methylation of damaged DNA